MKGQSPALLKNNLNVVDEFENGKVKKSRWFAFILYPEDARHEILLQCILRFPKIYKVAYILHDKDVYTEEDLEKEPNSNKSVGELKKAHYHVLLGQELLSTASGIARKFHSANLHVEVVRDSYAYLMYMLHQDFESIMSNKHIYAPEEMKGTPKLIARVLQKNNNFIQLRELCELLKETPDIASLVSFVADNPEYVDVFERYEYILVACVNQYSRLRGLKRDE